MKKVGRFWVLGSSGGVGGGGGSGPNFGIKGDFGDISELVSVEIFTSVTHSSESSWSLRTFECIAVIFSGACGAVQDVLTSLSSENDPMRKVKVT